MEVFQKKLVLKLVWPDFVWPLLTGGRYSEVAVSTGLTVPTLQWVLLKANSIIIISPLLVSVFHVLN